jgi:hypothetical protein
MTPEIEQQVRGRYEKKYSGIPAVFAHTIAGLAVFIKMLFILFTFNAVVVAGDAYHVKVEGTSSGEGSINNPWDLQTALSRTRTVQAGDTIWVHGGTYRGVFTSGLRGNASAPVIVKAVQGEDVILDGYTAQGGAVLSFEGQYTWVWGLTITCKTENRTGSPAITADYKDGVYFIGPYNKLINCVIRDNGGNGVGFWNPAIDAEIYGCIIYHNGNIGSTRGHGHAIYTQNTQGTKQIRDNIIFNSFGIGIHAYTENGSIQGFNIEGNTFFNCGLPYEKFLERHILVGGLKPADRVMVNGNYFYNRPAYTAKAMVQFGYGSSNLNAAFSNNYMVDGSLYCITSWQSIAVTYNTIASRLSTREMVSFDSYDNLKNMVFDNNMYHRGKLGSHSFDEWKNVTGQDGRSIYSSSTPQTTVYFMQKNEYEVGRANLSIYNWGQENMVAVDVSGLLSVGDAYEVLDVSNLPGGAIVSGVYSGSDILVPMQLTDVSLPSGNIPNPRIYVHTAPHFGAFVINRTKQEANPPSGNEPIDSHKSTIYPNPVINQTNIIFHSTQPGAVSVDIFDLAGKVIKSETINAVKGENQYSCDLSFLRQGYYVVTVNGNSGRIFTSVFLKSVK